MKNFYIVAAIVALSASAGYANERTTVTSEQKLETRSGETHEGMINVDQSTGLTVYKDGKVAAGARANEAHITAEGETLLNNTPGSKEQKDEKAGY